MAEKRTTDRFTLDVPVLVEGVNSSGEAFIERSCTTDISSRGAYTSLKNRVCEDDTLAITLFLPIKLRNKVYLSGNVARIGNAVNAKTGIGISFSNYPVFDW